MIYDMTPWRVLGADFKSKSILVYINIPTWAMIVLKEF